MNITSARGLPTPKTTWVRPAASRHRVHVDAVVANSWRDMLMAASLSCHGEVRSLWPKSTHGEPRSPGRKEPRLALGAPDRSADRLLHGLRSEPFEPALVGLDLPGCQSEGGVPVPQRVVGADGVRQAIVGG